MTATGITTAEVKTMNRSKVYHYIYDARITSKQEISQALHMSLATVSQNLKDLFSAGLLQKDGVFASTGGRKADRICVNPTAGIAIGAGIFKESFHLDALDLYGNVLKRQVYDHPYQNTSNYCEIFQSTVHQFIKELPYQNHTLLGIGIAIQGIVSPSGDEVLYGKILDCKDVSLEQISGSLPYPCRLEHDSKAAGSAVLWEQKTPCDSLVLLLNHNLGGALLLNGQVYQGQQMHSGSLEHLCIVPDGYSCYCGKRGCLEAYCSADSLSKISGSDIPRFFEKLRNGSSRERSVWEDYLKHLALAIHNVNVLIDCDIVVTGYLAPYLKGEDIALLTHLVQEVSPFELKDGMIQVYKYGKDASSIGAGLYYIRQFLQAH